MKNLRTACLVFIIFCSTVYIFRIQVLMAISMFEFSVIPGNLNSLKTTCTPQIAYHRGYSMDNKYPENSLESLNAAVNENASGIEVDISIKGTEIYVGHELAKASLTWKEFLNNYQRKFPNLIIDIKEVKDFDKITVEHLIDAQKYFNHILFIGRKCDLLNQIHNAGGEVSCEAMGVFAHHLLGWRWWSVNYKYLGTSYEKILKVLPKKLILWTLKDKAEIASICHLGPEIVLIDKN